MVAVAKEKHLRVEEGRRAFLYLESILVLCCGQVGRR